MSSGASSWLAPAGGRPSILAASKRSLCTAAPDISHSERWQVVLSCSRHIYASMHMRRRFAGSTRAELLGPPAPSHPGLNPCPLSTTSAVTDGPDLPRRRTHAWGGRSGAPAASSSARSAATTTSASTAGPASAAAVIAPMGSGQNRCKPDQQPGQERRRHTQGRPRTRAVHLHCSMWLCC